MLAQRTFLISRYSCICRVHSRGFSSSQSPCTSARKHPSSSPPTDALGLPLYPPWSVHDLINSYPSPALSDAYLTHLHDLAALVPPKECTPKFEQLKREMEDLVRLVEAVRIAPEGAIGEDRLPDCTARADSRRAMLDHPGEEHGNRDEPPSGHALLNHAQRTQNGFYLVDSAREKKT